MLHHLPDDLKRTGLKEIRRVLTPGGRFMALDFAAQSHGPLGHLLSLFGHARGERMVDKLTPMLKKAGFSDIEAIPTRHKNFAFIRAPLTVNGGQTSVHKSEGQMAEEAQRFVSWPLSRLFRLCRG